MLTPSRSLAHGLLTTLIVSTISTVGMAQERSSCRAPDEAGTRFLQHVKALATAQDSSNIQRRRKIAVPALSADQISLVRDESVCTGLVAPYEAETQRRDANTGAVIPGSGQLYVVHAGPVYLTTDPSKTMGEWGLLVVFDEERRVLYSGLY